MGAFGVSGDRFVASDESERFAAARCATSQGYQVVASCRNSTCRAHRLYEIYCDVGARLAMIAVAGERRFVLFSGVEAVRVDRLPEDSMSRRFRSSVIPLLTMLIAACSSSPDNGVEVIEPDVMDVSPPLREMAKVPTEQVMLRGVEAEPVREIPRKVEREGTRSAKDDPTVQTAFGPGQIPTTGANFEGMGTGLPGFTLQFLPPDTDGDIGPMHYIQVVNVGMTIFNRTTGAPVLGPISIRTLFNGFAGNCSVTDDGDAVVRYDRLANRWVISQFSLNNLNGPFLQCIAVSTSPDPTGSYNRYQFTYTALNDYPKLGLWPDGYYFTYNMFAPPNFSFAGGKVCAMDRVKMLAGMPATTQCFDTGTNFGGLLASDLDGPTPPATGAPNFVVALGVDTSSLAFWKFHVDYTTPASSTFTGPTTIPITTWSTPCAGRACVPEPGTTARLDGITDRLMNRAAYRNFTGPGAPGGAHESMVFNHSITAGTGMGVRWYELRNMSTTPTLFQQGTYAPDSSFRWMGSIAQDASGNMALGFTTSNATNVFPSVRYTGRLFGDPLGTMGQGEGTLVAGAGSQTHSSSRWGDYSSMNIDPIDDCTFWYTQEYETQTTSVAWRTRIGSFTFPGCGIQPNDFTMTPVPTSANLDAGMSTSFQINTTVINGNPQPVNLTISGLPPEVTATFNPATITSGQSSTLTLTATPNALPQTAALTIKGTGTGATRTTSVSITVINTNIFPTVAVTAPVNNTIVTGTITVAANAADADGSVASVTFDFPDGTSVVDNAAPFTTSWNTTTVTDGAGYVVKATVTDNRGAKVLSTANITVQNNGGGCLNNSFNAAGLPVPIPDNNPAGVNAPLSVIGNGTVGIMSLSLHITHTYTGDLKVTLVSPGGTQFVVWNRAGGANDDIVINNMDITAFKGQAAAGTWKLFVQDFASVDTGTIDSWSLSIMGTCAVTQHWSGSAIPDLPTIDNGSACATVMVASGGDSSLAKLDIAGRHDFRSSLRGTLAHNGTTAVAFPVGTFPSGSGPFSFTNRSIAGISGDASGTWTLCIIDTDGFGDTGVLNSWSVHD